MTPQNRQPRLTIAHSAQAVAVRQLLHLAPLTPTDRLDALRRAAARYLQTGVEVSDDIDELTSAELTMQASREAAYLAYLAGGMDPRD